MPITIIKKNQYESIFKIFSEVNNEIFIISPFVKTQMARKLASIINDNEVKCTIVTRFKRQNFVDGASDLAALEELLDAGANIYALKNLHAKLYVIDKDTVIIGSANFTTGGFKLNHELCVMFNKEDEITAEFLGYCENLLITIKSCNESIITQELIDKEKDEVNKIVQKTNNNCKTYSQKEYGALIEEISITDSEDIIQNAFDSNNDEIDEGIWLKFEGVASSRYDNKNKYEPFIPKTIKAAITCYPESKKPRRVREGDYVYIAVLSEDEHGKQMPIIVARGRSHAFHEDQIAKGDLLKERVWIKDWPAYCILYDMERLDTEIVNGIKHSQVLASFQNQLYVSSKGGTRPIEKLKLCHLQKSAIQITNMAKEYIDHEFDKLAKKYGVIRY